MGNAIKSALTETHKKFGNQNQGSGTGKFGNTYSASEHLRMGTYQWTHCISFVEWKVRYGLLNQRKGTSVL